MKEKLFSYISFYQWWKSIDKPILSLILILFLAGLFFSLVSTSLIASDKLDTNTYFFFFKHTVFVFFGFFLIFILSFIPEKEITPKILQNSILLSLLGPLLGPSGLYYAISNSGVHPGEVSFTCVELLPYILGIPLGIRNDRMSSVAIDILIVVLLNDLVYMNGLNSFISY